MTTFQQEWDEEMAMAVLENPDVDSQVWAEAVEWLLLYGPPHIKELLNQASETAAQNCFPELTPTSFSPDGQPLYDIKQLAHALGISEDEAKQKLQNKELEQGIRHLFSAEDALKIQ